jgi:chaperonin cofactor prefoldin
MYVSVIKQLIEKIETLETKVAALEAAWVQLN